MVRTTLINLFGILFLLVSFQSNALERTLTIAESSLITSVFDQTVPTSRIRIDDGLGASNRAWVRNTLISDGVASGLPSQTPFLHYVFFVGPSRYSDMSSAANRGLLIQMAAYVWLYRYRNTFVEWDSVTNINNSASYTVGSNWSDYNVAQASSVVRDWFSTGMNKECSARGGDRYPYIRDNILQSDNDAAYISNCGDCILSAVDDSIDLAGRRGSKYFRVSVTVENVGGAVCKGRDVKFARYMNEHCFLVSGGGVPLDFESDNDWILFDASVGSGSVPPLDPTENYEISFLDQGPDGSEDWLFAYEGRWDDGTMFNLSSWKCWLGQDNYP